MAGRPASVAGQLCDTIDWAGAMPDAVHQLQDVSFAETMSGAPESFQASLQTQIA